MHTRLKNPYRSERALLYAILMTTALLLLLLPNAILSRHLDPLVLVGALLLMGCAVTLIALAYQGKNLKRALGLLFGLWLMVWVSQGLLMPV